MLRQCRSCLLIGQFHPLAQPLVHQLDNILVLRMRQDLRVVVPVGYRFTDVFAHVQLQRRHLSEPLGALVALVGFLARVQPHVLVEHSLLSERLAAERATVGSVVRVNPDVLLEMGLLFEAFVAVVASERTLYSECGEVPGHLTEARGANRKKMTF